MNDCYYAKKDWRACSKEVSSIWHHLIFICKITSITNHTLLCNIPSCYLAPASLHSSCNFDCVMAVLTTVADGGLPRMLEAQGQRRANTNQGCIKHLGMARASSVLYFSKSIDARSPLTTLFPKPNCPCRLDRTITSISRDSDIEVIS